MLLFLNLAVLSATLTSDDLCTKQLDYLLARHREFGLQLPPQDAVLVECDEEGKSYLRFMLGDHSCWPSGRRYSNSFRCARPDPELLRAATPLDWLELALASHERGWKPLARTALRKWVVKHFRNRWSAEERLSFDATDFWEQQIYEAPGVPLSVIAKYLSRLQRYSLDSRKSRELLRSVELALEPRTSKPGSDEALIDALTEARGQSGPWGQLGGIRQDPRYRALLERGLDAVPALLVHLTDERITRARGRGCGDNHRRVKGLVLEILADLRGEGFAMEGYDLDQQRKELGDWFAGASKLGEEKYIVSQLLGDEDNSSSLGALVHVLATKYPQRLPEVFRAVIDTRPGQREYARHYARAVAEAPIPVAEKRKILQYAASQESDQVRAAGLRYLRPFDATRKAQFLKELAEMPAELNEAQTLSLAEEIAESADADERKALSLAVRRADATSRIALLSELALAEDQDGRKNRLVFVMECLADGGVGTDTSADAPFRRIEVRNFAAVKLAALLNADEGVGSDWAEFRERMWTAAVKGLLRR